MRLMLAGSGNTHGVPKNACHCQACTLAHQESNRRRQASCGVLLSHGGICIDAGASAITAHLAATHNILLTHFHPDHCLGLCNLPSTTSGIVYCPQDGHREFVLPPSWYWHQIVPFQSFPLEGLTITPLPLIHPIPTLGYALDDGSSRIAWLCDSRGLPSETIAFLQEISPTCIILDCSFAPGDPDGIRKQHGDLDTCFAVAQALDRPRTVLVHIDHSLDNFLLNNPTSLPPWMHLGHDLEVIQC